MTAQVVTGTFNRDRASSKDGVVAELFALQVEQFNHDEKYHREIARLTVHERLNHMALHFAKYVGAIAASSNDNAAIDRVLTDTLVIGISTANILNQRISDLLEVRNSTQSLAEFAASLAETKKIMIFNYDLLLRDMAVHVGNMAKACESIDHLEAYPFREKVEKSVSGILYCTLANMALRNLEPSTVVRERLQGVKAKSIFHGHI